MEKYRYNEENGLHYELIGNYYYPCLTVPESRSIYGKHKKILYQTLLYTEKLKACLEEIDHSAEDMFALLVKQLSTTGQKKLCIRN